MTLEVEAPGTYEPERRYILDVMLGDRLGLDWRLRFGERSDVRIVLAGDPSRYVVVPDLLFATPTADWLTPSALPARPLAWRQAPDATGLGGRVPVLYGVEAPDALIVPGPDGVELTVDVFGGAFFMLSRYEELVVPARDHHGRFAATSSLAYAEGFLGIPIVDAYAELLWSALQGLWPRLERRARSFQLALSHDVDQPLALAGRGAPALVRQLGADLLMRRDAELAGRRLRSWARLRRGDHTLDPYNTFDFLMDVSERHSIAGAFYFLATEEISALDGPYTLEQPWIEALIRRIHERDHEIGLHPSFETPLDPVLTEVEFSRLRDAAERQGVSQERWGGRQHYLRWQNPVTWSNWEAAGLSYDSTVGYADRIGFRAGTCHEFRPFHLLERRPLQLRERPLHVMDRTLFDYMKLSPDVASEKVLELARECRRYDGTFSLLCHNSSLPTNSQKRWYEALIAGVAA
jgi:hypothetical protein